MLRKSAGNPFWRGYSSSLGLYPACHRSRRFLYGGRDLTKTSSAEALGHDWKMVGDYLVAAFAKADDDERRSQSSR